MRSTTYAVLALGSLLTFSSPAQAKPIDTGSKAAANFTNPDVDYDQRILCYDTDSRRWKVLTEACEDARDTATMALDTYLKKLDVNTRARGVLISRCIPKEVSRPGGKAYKADARACVITDA